MSPKCEERKLDFRKENDDQRGVEEKAKTISKLASKAQFVGGGKEGAGGKKGGRDFMEGGGWTEKRREG